VRYPHPPGGLAYVPNSREIKVDEKGHKPGSTGPEDPSDEE
jgi:hypothetical protein